MAAHSGTENLKKTRPKKIREIKYINFTKKIFLTNSIFCNFKNGQKSIFELEKSLKLIKYTISRKNFFEQIPLFAISKMVKNQFLNWKKVKV